MSLPFNITKYFQFETAQASRSEPPKPILVFAKTPDEVQVHLNKLSAYLFDVAIQCMDKGNDHGYSKYSAMSDCVTELEGEILTIEIEAK